MLQHAATLQPGAVQLGLGSAGAQAALQQPVDQVAAPKHALNTGLWVETDVGRG